MRGLKLPFLALLSSGLLAALWSIHYFGEVAASPKRLLLSCVLAVLYGWPALFGLARSFGAGAFGRSFTAAVIALSPALVMVALFACQAVLGAAWLRMVLGVWLVAQAVAVPIAWAAARAWFARHGSLPNNSSKPTPLRGAA